MWVAFANAKATHIFSAKILTHMPYLMIKVLTIRWLTTSLVLNNWALVIIPIAMQLDLGRLSDYSITKTYLYNFDPLKPHFYIVKLGFTGVYNIILFLVKNRDCGYSLEPPRRGGSNEYPQPMFWTEIWKMSEIKKTFSVFGCKIFNIFE